MFHLPHAVATIVFGSFYHGILPWTTFQGGEILNGQRASELNGQKLLISTVKSSQCQRSKDLNVNGQRPSGLNGQKLLISTVKSSQCQRSKDLKLNGQKLLLSTVKSSQCQRSKALRVQRSKALNINGRRYDSVS